MAAFLVAIVLTVVGLVGLAAAYGIW